MAHRVVCFGDACKLVLPEPMYPSRSSHERSAPTPPPALIPVAEPCRNRTTRPPYSISRDPQARVSSKRAFRRSDRHGLCAQWLQGLSLTTCIPLFAFSVPENPEPSQREKRVSNDTLQEAQRRVNRADSPPAPSASIVPGSRKSPSPLRHAYLRSRAIQDDSSASRPPLRSWQMTGDYLVPGSDGNTRSRTKRIIRSAAL